MKSVHVLTVVILISIVICAVECRGRGGRGRSGSRSRSRSNSGSVSKTSSSNTGSGNGFKGYSSSSSSRSDGFKPEYSNSGSQSVGFKPEYSSSGSQGIGFKPAYSSSGSQGIGFKPEYSSSGSQGIGFKPAYSHLGSQDIGFKPEYSHLGSNGIGFKPEYSNLGSQGIGFKPEYSNLGSQGIGFKPEYTQSKQTFFNGYGANNLGYPRSYQPGSYDQTFGPRFKPNYGIYPQNDGFKPQHFGVNQQPYYDRPSLPMVLPIPIGSGNTHYIHYYNNVSPYSHYGTERRTNDNIHVHGGTNSSQVDALNPGFIEGHEITPFYKPGYILPNKHEDAQLKAWRAMILKNFGTTSRTVIKDVTSTTLPSTTTYFDKLLDSSKEDEIRKRINNLGI